MCVPEEQKTTPARVSIRTRFSSSQNDSSAVIQENSENAPSQARLQSDVIATAGSRAALHLETETDVEHRVRRRVHIPAPFALDVALQGPVKRGVDDADAR